MGKLWAVYRVVIGMGLVDYCGSIYAASENEALDAARLLYPWRPGRERIEVEIDTEVQGRPIHQPRA